MLNPSLVVRRTHMYLGLFLFPWMLMYALSTAAMNHRAFFVERYGSGPPAYEKDREFFYDDAVPEDASELRTISRRILDAAGLNGAHGVTRRKDGVIVITRNDLVRPRRLTYTPSTRVVLVEKMPHRSNAFLERFHRRRGYATGYTLDTIWAVSVDLVIGAMVIWAFSGLWMWWQMQGDTRARRHRLSLRRRSLHSLHADPLTAGHDVFPHATAACISISRSPCCRGS